MRGSPDKPLSLSKATPSPLDLPVEEGRIMPGMRRGGPRVGGPGIITCYIQVHRPWSTCNLYPGPKTVLNRQVLFVYFLLIDPTISYNVFKVF